MSEPLDPVEIARDVLAREARAIGEASERLGDSFRRAVELLETRSGRIIVTGVGKSGAIGAKIAATLTSTGRPATSLHPTEAMHGDLGLVGRDDVVLALSKSGRSPELLQLVPFLRRLGAAVIAIVESATSPLAQAADVALELGKVEEACSLDLVPTSSTTATLALGDALAVALLRRRGLTSEDLAYVHPGGLIGRQVATLVREVMHAGTRFPRVPPDAPLREALLEIVEKGLGVTTVVDASGNLAGILTDGDLKRILLRQDVGAALLGPVRDVMSHTPRTIGVEEPVGAAVRRMEERLPGPVTSLVVVENGRPVGIVHLHDCLTVGISRP